MGNAACKLIISQEKNSTVGTVEGMSFIHCDVTVTNKSLVLLSMN